VADVIARLTQVKPDLAAEKDLAKQLHVLNSEESQKMSKEVAGSLTRVTKADEQFIDLAFLLLVSRFPKANETEQASAHLKKVGRQLGTEDIIWSLLNTKEFRQPQ
jgi:hypothetical protein